jgi:capsid protein
VRWDADAWEAIDRQKEAAADLAEVRAGFASMHDIAARRGKDYDVLIGERDGEQKDLDARGLILDSDPSKQTAQGQPAAQQAAPDASSDTPT